MNLYIGNLSYTTTEEELRELFETVGTVTSVKIISDRETGRSRGFGFVEMSNSSEADEAINKLNGHTLHDRDISVSKARSKETNQNSRNRFKR